MKEKLKEEQERGEERRREVEGVKVKHFSISRSRLAMVTSMGRLFSDTKPLIIAAVSNPEFKPFIAASAIIFPQFGVD